MGGDPTTDLPARSLESQFRSSPYIDRNLAEELTSSQLCEFLYFSTQELQDLNSTTLVALPDLDVNAEPWDSEYIPTQELLSFLRRLESS